MYERGDVVSGTGNAPGCGGGGPSDCCAGIVLVGEGLFMAVFVGCGTGVGPGNGTAPGRAEAGGGGKKEPKTCPGPDIGDVGQSVLSFVGV